LLATCEYLGANNLIKLRFGMYQLRFHALELLILNIE
jgi:hypothetical protein